MPGSGDPDQASISITPAGANLDRGRGSRGDVAMLLGPVRVFVLTQSGDALNPRGSRGRNRPASQGRRRDADITRPGDGMTGRWMRLRALLLVLALATVALGASACVTVRLAGDYDAQVDSTATEMQKRMDTFLTRLESLPEGDSARAYAPNQRFYLDYGVDLRALEIRAAGLPRNGITLQQVDLMERSLEQLRGTHQAQNRLSTASLGEYRELFNTAWRAVLALELAKKRS